LKTTLSVIKADIGSLAGHMAPSKRLLETVEAFVRENGRAY
jgi:fructose 1,6-bisphosphate aldolase/phosphatase